MIWTARSGRRLGQVSLKGPIPALYASDKTVDEQIQSVIRDLSASGGVNTLTINVIRLSAEHVARVCETVCVAMLMVRVAKGGSVCR